MDKITNLGNGSPGLLIQGTPCLMKCIWRAFSLLIIHMPAFSLSLSDALLLLSDDGGGMCPDTVRHCMSFGFSYKSTRSAIGQCMNLI